MVDFITETAFAKVNLALHVRQRRADGYHALETLFAFVDGGDALRVSARGDGELRLTLSGPFADDLAGEGDNLVLRAARAQLHQGVGALEMIRATPDGHVLGMATVSTTAVDGAANCRNSSCTSTSAPITSTET
mgnify:CR=1 FL=1